MGSFNETCALSGLNIPYGTPVRVLFLTQNPYVNSDQHEAQRGCYSHDQWFVRTPPFKGKYDDYGRAKFRAGSIPKLIAQVFSKDVIERPFGFNQYHAPACLKNQDIKHYLQVAWEGRLLVKDDYPIERDQIPETWPTWQKVHAAIKEAGLPLQIDKLKDMENGGGEGYNAQPILPGVVCVEFNSYGDNANRLKAISNLLADKYDSKIVYKFQDRAGGESCLMVTAKGAFENTTLLHQGDKYRRTLDTHPEHRDRYRALPCLAVMVREDVWQAFVKLKMEKHWHGPAPTVESVAEKLKKGFERQQRLARKTDMDPADLREMMSDGWHFRDVLETIPCTTGPAKHLSAAAEDPKFPESAVDELLLATAELSKVQYVMNILHRSWHIPPLGGQDENWETNLNLFTALTAICQKEYDKYRQETDEAEEEDADEGDTE